MAAVRWWTDSPLLGPNARQVIERSGNAIYVSAVSVWEIANKNRIGKLDDIVDFPGEFPTLMRRNGFTMLDVTSAHAMRAGYLAGAHRDPFDRLLAGQALVEDMIVVTNDPEIAAFGCKVIW